MSTTQSIHEPNYISHEGVSRTNEILIREGFKHTSSLIQGIRRDLNTHQETVQKQIDELDEKMDVMNDKLDTLIEGLNNEHP